MSNITSSTASKTSLLEVIGLQKHFTLKSGLFNHRKLVRKAVDGVSFAVAQGEILGLVGESGCGKTTTGLCLLRGIEPTAGSLRMHLNGATVDLMQLGKEQLRRFRRHAQMIFQDPFSSLNPRMTVLDIISEPLRAHGIVDREHLASRAIELMQLVGLSPQLLLRYPHAFSGGQRQRIGIARALALNPRLIVADEPVSALDVSVQAQIINLLKDLREQLNVAFIFISHDLGVVKHTCDRIAVMYAGKIVEEGPVDDLYRQPLHPYTEALLSAVPRPDPRQLADDIILGGEVPDPAKLETGCAFRSRCRYAQMRCVDEVPPLREITENRWVACARAEELTLRGSNVTRV